jgi:Spy/CpxP family protein refolding chaperone
MSTVSVIAEIQPQRHHLTRREYHLLAQAGVFDSRRVELLAGEIYEHMAAMLSPHATSVRKFTRLFPKRFETKTS